MVTNTLIIAPCAAHQQHAPTNPVPFAIGQHRRAYTARQVAYARLTELHERLDIEHDIQDHDAIREALTIVHGTHAPEEIARYFAAEATANTAAQDEDEAWRRVVSLEPASREDLTAWLAYVIEHARKEPVDGAVMLAEALTQVGGMLAERLPA